MPVVPGLPGPPSDLRLAAGAGPEAVTPRVGVVPDLPKTWPSMTNATVARRLGLAESTVKQHLKNILRKLEVGSRAEAVAYW